MDEIPQYGYSNIINKKNEHTCFDLVSVVYFNQRLGALHSKQCLKYAFQSFLCITAEKSNPKTDAKFSKKNIFFEFAPERSSGLYN